MTNRKGIILPKNIKKIKRPQKEKVLELPVPPIKQVVPPSSSLEDKEIIIDLYGDDMDVFLI